MTHRAAIVSDLIRCNSMFLEGMPFQERRHIAIRVKRLYAELDALMPS
jgi:hypothetical protein